MSAATLNLPTEAPIQEFTNSRGVSLQVDAAAGVIRGVKILGSKSKNGREYPAKTIADAASKYERSKVNVNHPKGRADSPRGYEDRVGVIRGVRVSEGGLYGDLHYNPKHALAGQLAWDAEHAPENVGLSHNVLARTARKNGVDVVEAILRVQSVDLVADPATTSGLFEHETPDPEDKTMTLTIEDVRANDAVHAALKREWLAEQADSDATKETAAKLADLIEQSKALTEQVDGYKAAESQAKRVDAVDAMIKEAKLPEHLVSDVLRQSLMEADDKRAAALIEERQKLAKQTKPGTGRPKSSPAHLAESMADNETPEQKTTRWRCGAA